jgi:hypothetical protein
MQDVERISYEAPGRMMLCQGSEILHHVTPIRSVRSVRSIGSIRLALRSRIK